MAARGDLEGGGAGQPRVITCGEVGIRSDHVDEVVRDADLVVAGGLGGANLKLAVDGHRVAADDLATEAPSQCQGERGFSAGSGTGDDDQRRLAVGSSDTQDLMQKKGEVAQRGNDDDERQDDQESENVWGFRLAIEKWHRGHSTGSRRRTDGSYWYWSISPVLGL